MLSMLTSMIIRCLRILEALVFSEEEIMKTSKYNPPSKAIKNRQERPLGWTRDFTARHLLRC